MKTVKDMSPEQLARSVAGYDQDIAQLKEERTEVIDLLVERLDSAIENAFAAKGVDHGRVTIYVNSVPITVERKKTVSWDDDKLKEWSNRMAEDGHRTVLEAMLQVTARISEANYSDLLERPAAEVHIDALREARTVKIDTSRITKIKIDEE